MRWYWIDRFVEFESGQRAKAIKNVSLAEDHLHDHFPYWPVMPNSLVIEGMAQTGGLLVCEHSHFVEKVILAKVAKAHFFFDAVPGDTLLYTATVEYIKSEGAMVHVTSHRGDQLQAEAEIMFAHLNGDYDNQALFLPDTLLHMMRILGAYEVGHAADGSRLAPPSDPLESSDHKDIREL